jgi:Uma2 family endonuclease
MPMNVSISDPSHAEISWLDLPYHITADEYLRMVDSGVFRKSSRIILWNGQLHAKMTKNQPHTIALWNLGHRLGPIIPGGWFVNQEAPIRLSEKSVPEPDLTVVRGVVEDYPTLPPGPGDVALLIEIADSSLRLDRRALADFAAAGIPACWIVNLIDRRIETFSDPDPSAKTYRTTRSFGPDDEVPVVIDGREVGRIEVRDVLPRAEGTPRP